MRLTLIGSMATVALSASMLTGQQVLHTFNGSPAGDWFGTSVSGAGDVNGDGYGDVIVGDPGANRNGSGSGSVLVFFGRNGSILYSFDGDSADDQFGYSVGGAGDVNGDGFADVIVGAWWDDNNGHESGSARVFSGRDGSILYTFNGDSAYGYCGKSVSGAGDVNGDGYADLIVGARSFAGNNSASGSARVFSGRDGSIIHTLHGSPINSEFGASVSSAGDVNGDGYADLIVGAWGDDRNGAGSGSAWVLSGQGGAILYTFDGDASGQGFGISVSGAGDVNGDGHDDLIVGAKVGLAGNAIKSGSVRVFSGLDGSTLVTLHGRQAWDWFGSSVSGANDVSGEGYSDFIIGAWGSGYSGSAVIMSLGLTGHPAHVTYQGDGCPGSNGHLPRISVDGRPGLGQSFSLKLTGGVPVAHAFMLVGSTWNQNLGFAGFPQCTVLVQPLASFLSVIDLGGFASSPAIAVPGSVAMIGVTLGAQVVVVDLAAGLSVSNAAVVNVGS